MPLLGNLAEHASAAKRPLNLHLCCLYLRLWQARKSTAIRHPCTCWAHLLQSTIKGTIFHKMLALTDYWEGGLGALQQSLMLTCNAGVWMWQCLQPSNDGPPAAQDLCHRHQECLPPPKHLLYATTCLQRFDLTQAVTRT